MQRRNGLFALVLLLWGTQAACAASVPDHEWLVMNYRKLSSEGRVQEAQEQAERVIKQSEDIIQSDPTSDEAAQAYLNMALTYGIYGKRDFAKADQAFKEAIEAFPHHRLLPAIRYYYARNIAWGFRSERLEEALRIYEEIPLDHPESEYALRARIEQTNWLEVVGGHVEGKEEKVIALFKQLVAEHPNTASGVEAAYALFGFAMRDSDLKAAKQWTDQIALLEHPLAEEYHAWALARWVSADILVGRPDLDEAKKAIDDALSEMEDDRAKVHLLAAVLEANGLLDESSKRWKLVAYCCERLIDIATGEQRARAMYDLAGIYLYHYQDEGARRKGIDEALQRKGLELLDQIMQESQGQPWALKAETAVASYWYHISWDVPGRKEIREDAMSRFLAIADEHPGTPEASLALHKLANHYTVAEYFDPERASGLALRFLQEDPHQNADEYAQLVSLIMRSRPALLNLVEPDVLDRARRVIKQYPEFTSAEKQRFVRDVRGWHGNDRVERTLAEVLKYARSRKDRQLEREVLMLQGECYFSKERPREAIEFFEQVQGGYSSLLTVEDERLIGDIEAMSYFWLREFDKALECLSALEASAPEPDEAAGGGEDRPKPHYAYLRGVVLCEKGDWEASVAVFDNIVKTYPDTPWARRAESHARLVRPVLQAFASGGAGQ